MTLYEELVAAGCRIGNHESDLYVRADDISRPIIHAAVKAKRIARPALFASQRPDEKGQLWYEIPFAYVPFWEIRLQAPVKGATS